MTARTRDTASALESASWPEFLLGAAPRTRAPNQNQAPIFPRPAKRHDDAGHDEGRHENEVRDRDEEPAERKAPEDPQSHQHAHRSLRRRLLDDDRRRVLRRKSERGERGRLFCLSHRYLLPSTITRRGSCATAAGFSSRAHLTLTRRG